MTTAIAEHVYSPDDLLTMPDGDRYEVVHGHLVERNVGLESTGIGSQVFGLLWQFLQEHQLGFPLMADAVYACVPEDRNHSRRPEVSFIRFGRLPDDRLPKGHCRIPPDLVVEVVSPNDTFEEVSEKVAEFQAVGVPLIWVVDPVTHRAIVHRLSASPDARLSELTEADTIGGEDVLPGFSCLVAKFFALSPRPR